MTEWLRWQGGILFATFQDGIPPVLSQGTHRNEREPTEMSDRHHRVTRIIKKVVLSVHLFLLIYDFKFSFTTLNQTSSSIEMHIMPARCRRLGRCHHRTQRWRPGRRAKIPPGTASSPSERAVGALSFPPGPTACAGGDRSSARLRGWRGHS